MRLRSGIVKQDMGNKDRLQMYNILNNQKIGMPEHRYSCLKYDGTQWKAQIVRIIK